MAASSTTTVYAPSALNAFTYQEGEFLAEEEPISIMPNFSIEKLVFIERSYGPFQPLTPIVVPLWLAIAMKNARKCQIQAPEWMDVAQLKVWFEKEKTETDFLAPLPFYYKEISQLLIRDARDDIAGVTEVESIINLLETLRADKVRNMLRALNKNSVMLDAKGFGSYEINRDRQFIISTLGSYRALPTGEEAAASTIVSGAAVKAATAAKLSLVLSQSPAPATAAAAADGGAAAPAGTPTKTAANTPAAKKGAAASPAAVAAAAAAAAVDSGAAAASAMPNVVIGGGIKPLRRFQNN